MVYHQLHCSLCLVKSMSAYIRDLRLMGGLRGQLQYLPFFLMFFVAALVGVPGLGNFIGEF